MVGSGNCVLADVRGVDLSRFDAVWASPPCQARSPQNHGIDKPEYADYEDLLQWSLALPHDILWVENVLINTLPVKHPANSWGDLWNAAQFEQAPRQNRNRIIGGRYTPPAAWRGYRYSYPELDICPAVVASERNGAKMHSDPTKERRKASKWYGRPLSISEMAYHQGLEIPHTLLKSWWYPLAGYTSLQWTYVLSSATGNGVPVYMARAFGEAYSKPHLTAGMIPELARSA
jgi:hypothetical protein